MSAKKTENNPTEEAAKETVRLYEILRGINGNTVFSQEFRNAIKWQAEKIKWKHNELIK